MGRYMGLRRDPKFLQALDAVRPAWAPEPVPELLEEDGLVEDGAPVVGVVAVASVARGRCVQRGASLGSSVSVGRGVASLGAAAPVGQAPSEAARQATAALLVRGSAPGGDRTPGCVHDVSWPSCEWSRRGGATGWGSSAAGWWVCTGWCGKAFGSRVGSRAWAGSGAWACWSGGKGLSSPAFRSERGCLLGGWW